VKRSKKVPGHFWPLQELGVRCENYYTGDGGKKIGLTPEILREVGLVDDTLWIHPSVMSKLEMASMKILAKGFHILVKDAWRPVKLYRHIVSQRKMKGLHVEGLINEETMPHATGMAIDVVLVNPTTNSPVMMRNHARDGQESIFVNYYTRRHGDDCREFQRLQDILIFSFIEVGFRLGSKKEYWHFELPALDTAVRF
jgi:D-alanyl-D-alanine dipeptidase